MISSRPRSNTSLILDLDGTISDPATGILRSINYALAHFGYACIADSDVGRFIGPPIDDSFRRLTGSTARAHILELVARFRERYAEVGYRENALYPGIREALSGLAAAGFRLGVCTSKRADFAEKILAMFELRGYLAFVSGGDVGIAKGAQLADLRRREEIGPASTMIGDRAEDMRAGSSNGLRTVGVLWGHGTESELLGAGADLLLREPAELRSLDHPGTR